MTGTPVAPSPRPLGRSAKSLHRPQQVKTAETANEAGERRRRRYDLTATAGGILWERGAHWKDQHRTVWCHRGTHAAEGEALPILRAIAGTGARMGDVVTCGHGWTCPVCGSKIAEKRRAELALGIERHVDAGGGVYLLSLTIPHTVRDDLAGLLELLTDARQRWRNAKRVKAILGTDGSAGSVGSIAALEVTVGWNGWHPHVHMLALTDRRGLAELPPLPDSDDLAGAAIDTLKVEWARVLLKVGAIQRDQVADVVRYGLNVRGGEKAAEYIAKYGESSWSLSREVASRHAKIGIRGTQAGFRHFTPFQLLEVAQAEGPHAIQARAMFREFAGAFKSRRMLVWSPGLKGRLDLVDVSDEDIAAELGEPVPGEEHQVATVTEAQFGRIVAAGALGDFLEYVRRECYDLMIAQDMVDGYVERLAQLQRDGPPYLRGVRWHSWGIPHRLRYETTEGAADA